jgi:hypothetical protein
MKPEFSEKIIELLNQIRSIHKNFFLEKYRYDTFIAIFLIHNYLVEIDFFDDHFEFSHFRSDGKDHRDWALLERLLGEHWGDDDDDSPAESRPPRPALTLLRPTGIADLLAFLDDLRRLRITFRLRVQAEDAVTIFWTWVGCRVELDLRRQDASFRYYLGDEFVYSDWSEWEAMLAGNPPQDRETV